MHERIYGLFSEGKSGVDVRRPRDSKAVYWAQQYAQLQREAKGSSHAERSPVRQRAAWKLAWPFSGGR